LKISTSEMDDKEELNQSIKDGEKLPRKYE
jgi:hypothetical protein